MRFLALTLIGMIVYLLILTWHGGIMHTNMQQLTITLNPIEADSLRRDIEALDPHLIPYNSRLAELLHVLRTYRGKT